MDRTPTGTALGRLAGLTWRVGQTAPVASPRLLPDRLEAEGTRRRIYEVALVLFAERGYHGVSVRDITKDVGVHASSLYAHVASKQQLLADLLRAGHAEHDDWLRAAAAAGAGDPAEPLRAIVRAHVRMHATFPLLTRVCNRELGALDPETRAEILAIRLEAEGRFLTAIEDGPFSPAQPLLAVAAIGAMGIRVAEWWHPDLGIDIDVLADTYADYAIRLVT